jgi:hypothetical protein
MNAAEKVFEALKKSGQPLGAGKIAELSGLERKEVDKAMKELKDKDMIFSPKRCFWQVRDQ